MRRKTLVVGHIEQALAALAMAATLLALVSFVALLGFSIYGGWLQKKRNAALYGAVQR
jgi:hypothetical protein